jgi:6-phosphogluconolactonase
MNKHIFATTDEISSYITAKIKSLLQSSIGIISIALSGGNTPKKLFHYLKDHQEELAWERIHFYWVDERCALLESAESNAGEAKRILFDFLPSAKLSYIDGTNNPSLEVARMSTILDISIIKQNNIPQFDLILLGIGIDGHTASIFPNTMSLLADRAYYAVSKHPESGQLRITLTGTIINNAKNVVFVVTGADKTSVLHQILEHNGNWKSFPASYINPVGTIEWVIDNDAFGVVEKY